MEKTIRSAFGIVLALLLCLGMMACTRQEEGANTDESDAPASDSTPSSSEGETKNDETSANRNVTAKRLYADRDGVRLIGARATKAEDGIYLDFAGSGFEVALHSEDGAVNFLISGSGVFRVWADGTEQKNEAGGYLHTLEKSMFIRLTGLTVGDHVIRVVKADGNGTHAVVSAAVFDGTISDSLPEQVQTRYIEFVGDESLTVGADVTLGYAYRTAQQLNAAYMITAWNGADVATGEHTVKTQYPYVNPYETDGAKQKPYDFAKQADAVVLSVGKNDTCDASVFEAAYIETIRDLLKKNGTDTKVYCVFDASNPYGENIRRACAALGGEDSGIYALLWDSTEEASRAEQLSALIERTIAAATAPVGSSGIGTIVDWSDGQPSSPKS